MIVPTVFVCIEPYKCEAIILHSISENSKGYGCNF